MQQNKDIRIILNPAADNGRGVLQQGPITEIVQAYAQVDFVLSTSADHARQSAREAAEAGYSLVVAAGGDGTVHQVVNGIMDVPESKAKLGVIPIGSGNDFAFANGIPTNVQAAASLLFQGQPRWIDLARVEDENGRFVIIDNNFGIGFDAMVVVQTEKITWAHGFMKYLVAVFTTLAFHFKPTQLRINFDDELVTEKSLFFYVGIGPRGGGGFLLTPDARQDDGLIDSCLVDNITRRTLLGMLTKAMKGTHIHNKHASMHVSRQIVVHLDDLAPMYVDGEMFVYPEDNIRQITITSLPQGIQLVA